MKGYFVTEQLATGQELLKADILSGIILSRAEHLPILSGSLSPWRVIGLRMEDTASSYGR